MFVILGLGLVLLCFCAFPVHMRRAWGKKVKWACEECGKKFRDGWALEFHHKNPTSNGGKDTWDNIKCLCMKCHAFAHELLAKKGLGHKSSAGLIWYRYRKTRGGRTKEWIKKNR